MVTRQAFALDRESGLLISTGKIARNTRKLGFCLHRMNYTKLTRCEGKPKHAECAEVRLAAMARNTIIRKRKVSNNPKPRTSDHKAIPTKHSQTRKDGTTPDMRTTIEFDSNARSVEASRFASLTRLTATELGLGNATDGAATEKS